MLSSDLDHLLVSKQRTWTHAVISSLCLTIYLDTPNRDVCIVTDKPYRHISATHKCLFYNRQMFLTSNCRPPNPSSSPPLPHHPCGARSGPPRALSSHDLPVTKDAAETLLRMSSSGDVIPAGPVKSAVLRASQRSYRSPPSKLHPRPDTSGAECDVTAWQEVCFQG